ncbi:hypothetical protein, partial [Escherichia coli]|uniref:hypothetical protein n=1 Tax=Escherichia coli TaxID=562 RepID=UPI001BDB951A
YQGLVRTFLKHLEWSLIHHHNFIYCGIFNADVDELSRQRSCCAALYYIAFLTINYKKRP